MMLDNGFIKDLILIPWFVNCGKPHKTNMSFEVESLNSWKEAEKHFSAPEWKYVTGEAQGNLTSYLSQKYPNKYQGDWNKLVKEAKPKVEQIVVPHINSLISKENINPVFGDCVKWDILHAIMELTYVKCNPPLFFLNLFEIYKFGNLPCGWNGKWPDGKLLVF